MRLLWLATQPKIGLPSSPTLFDSLWTFSACHQLPHKTTNWYCSQHNKIEDWDTNRKNGSYWPAVDLQYMSSPQHFCHIIHSMAPPPSLNIFCWDQTIIKPKTQCALRKLCKAVSAVSGEGFSVRLQVELRKEEGVYGHNNGRISSRDRVSTVINHALWFWPHQGTSKQEAEILKGTTHTKGRSLVSRPRHTQNGCTSLC